MLSYKRAIDKLGRVVLPKEWRSAVGLNTKDELCLHFSETMLVLIPLKAETSRSEVDLHLLLNAVSCFPSYLQPAALELVNLAVEGTFRGPT